jgi:hypothetical protein
MGSWEILHIKPHRRTRLRWIVSRQWRMWICQSIRHIHILYYMDMSKAFDKVDHEVLIQKLQKDYGFGGNLLRWFRCYLENRKQRV